MTSAPINREQVEVLEKLAKALEYEAENGPTGIQLVVPSNAEKCARALRTLLADHAAQAEEIQAFGDLQNEHANLMEASRRQDELITAQAETIKSLSEALKAARKEAVINWVFSAQRLGVTGTYPDLVKSHGVPPHIAAMDEALSNSLPNTGEQSQ